MNERDRQLWLHFANTEAGRYLLRIKCKEPVVDIGRNHFAILKGFIKDRAIIQHEFHSADWVASKFEPIFTKTQFAWEAVKRKEQFSLSEAFLYYAGLNNNFGKYPEIHLASPESYWGSVGGCGRMRSSWTETNWTTVRNAADAASVDNTTTTTLNWCRADLSTVNYRIDRGGFTFNTAALPDICNITAASIWIWVGVIGSRDDNEDVDCVSYAPASNTAMAVGDYDALGLTVFGSVAYPFGDDQDWSVYTEWALNSNGRGEISKDGYSRFGFRSSYDTDNIPPTDADDCSGVLVYNGAGDDDPYIIITYNVITATTNYLKYYRRTRFPGSITGI